MLPFLLLAALPAFAEPPAPPLRVLVYNIYGRRENDCEQRYRALAAQILAASPPYDIVALNEHWKVRGDRWFTCDADVLTRAIESDGRYAGAGRSLKHRPSTTDVFQTSGGNSVFTLHRITDAHEGHFVNGRPIPLSGYLLARVDLGGGRALDLWNVHLEAGSDGCDRDCRLEQMTDFGSSVELFKEKNPALIVGDFNIGGPLAAADKPPFPGNPGYQDILDTFYRPRDLWLESGAGEGFTYDCAQNRIPSCKGRERIDYMFLPESREILDPDSDYVLVPKKIEVVRWKTSSGMDVSDHYGLDATLELRRRVRASVSSLSESLGPMSRRLQGLAGRPFSWD